MAQTVREYTGAIKDTVSSFWHGMSITLSHLFRRPMTVQYPDRTPLPVPDLLPPRYRGFLEVDVDICTGCQACERACPIGCLQITLEKDAANPKQRVVTQFDIDEAKCMFCGLCVEPCPTGSIQHTREFEGSQRNIRNLVFRWADPEKPFPVYKVDKNAEYYPRVPLGALVRAKLDERAWDAPGPKFLAPEPPKPPAEKPAAKAGAAAGAAGPGAAGPGAAKAPGVAKAPAAAKAPGSGPSAAPAGEAGAAAAEAAAGGAGPSAAPAAAPAGEAGAAAAEAAAGGDGQTAAAAEGAAVEKPR
jgi:NADH-quinone oxidoreductase subunit I